MAPTATPAIHPRLPAMGLRVAVVGARRARNGTGPYLAREASALGAEVVSILGTRPSSTETACTQLKEWGISAKPFTHFDPMVRETHPDVLIVASPAGTHRPWLEAAAESGMHVLCEKPLLALFDDAGKAMLRRFSAQGKVLAENCQWPFTLFSFQQLHPSFDPSKVKRFRMLLSPQDRGRTRWLETLSHPLSLLQDVFHGPAKISEIQYQEVSPSAPDARLNFLFTVFDQEIHCEVLLEDTNRLPRPAEFAFDDMVCRRRIETPGYHFSFDTGFQPIELGDGPALSVKAEDPLHLRMTEFMIRVSQAVKTGNAPLDESLLRRQQLMEKLLAAYRP